MFSSKIQIGDVFGDLLVTGFQKGFRKSGSPKVLVTCKCNLCGSDSGYEKQNLTKGNSTKCKPCAAAITGNKRRKLYHGYNSKTATPLEKKCYYTWQAMKRRCLKNSESCFDRYGGRGILVCEKWKNNYQAFFEDMGLPPSMDHQIDRVDNDGNYEPSNCRWVTRQENARNKSNNSYLEHKGKILTIAEWAEVTGLDRGLIESRVSKGWPMDKVFSPKMTGGKHRSITTPHGIFSTIQECAVHLDVSHSTVFSRIKSVNFKDWYYNEDV
jgi:hypothetical protein